MQGQPSGLSHPALGRRMPLSMDFGYEGGLAATPMLSGGGAVSSVSNSDGTLTISPTTGTVVASLALGHANIWTALPDIQFGNQP